MRERITGRTLAVVITVAAFLVLVLAAAQLYILHLPPVVSKDQATAIAIAHMQQQLGVREWSLVRARYDPAPDKIYDDSGQLIGSESRSNCRVFIAPLPPSFCHANAAWIFHLQAAAGTGSYSDAYVVINATTGQVTASSALTR